MSLHEPQPMSETTNHLPAGRVEVELFVSNLHPDDAHAADDDGLVEVELCIGDDEPDPD